MSDGEKTPAKKEGITWSCVVNEGVELPENFVIHVGTRVLLTCEGDFIKEPFTEYSQIQFEKPEYNNFLKIEDIKASENEKATFVMIPYRPGDYSKIPLVINDGEKSVNITTPDLEVKSVVDAQKGEKLPPAPYMMGGREMLVPSWPWWVMASAFIAGGLALYFVIQKIRRYFQRKELIEGLARHGTALTPYNQLNKDLRKLARIYSSKANADKMPEYLDELDKSFRMYLVRQLWVPAEDWSSREVLAEVKSRYRRVYEDHGPELRRVLRELDKAKKSNDRLDLVDCEQLAHMSQVVGDRIMKRMRKTK